MDGNGRWALSRGLRAWRDIKPVPKLAAHHPRHGGIRHQVFDHLRLLYGELGTFTGRSARLLGILEDVH